LIYVVDLEAVDTRYTKQWKTHVPELLQRELSEPVTVISGGETPQATTPGAFLNFGGTNVYKSKQLEQIGELFCAGEVKDGDYFLYTDAWNPTVIQLKYMAELLGVKIKIGGLWHAGSYDSQDFLGRLIGDKPWVRHAEKSMYEVFDHNFFASAFHIKMFYSVLNHPWQIVWSDGMFSDGKITRTGWPMEYMADTLAPYTGLEKRDIILFPHRIAPEKQPEIFKDLQQSLPQYKFVMCQEQQLSKDEYHTLLGEAKMVFSANLQETLGISWYEGALVDAIPMVPDRLSYSEMAIDDFKYPSAWTESFDSYLEHKQEVIDAIVDYMENYDNYVPAIAQQVTKLKDDYFGCSKLISTIRDRSNYA
jgi:hypothetical protein